MRPMGELGRDPNLRIAIISETATQARKWLARIKDNIQFNPAVRQVWPNLRPATRNGGMLVSWLNNAITVERDRMTSLREKDYSIEAMGVGGSIMGSRIDLAILDDVITERNAFTRAGREKIYDWIKRTLIGRLTEQGRILAINNTWHELDAYHVLAKENPDVWHVETYNAGDHNCQWPEVWPDARLAARRNELGDQEYARQMLNVPIGEATNLLPYESIRRCQELCTDPPEWWGGQYHDGAFRWITAGVDLGASERAGSNLTAIAVVGETATHKHLLHLRSGMWVGKALLQEILAVQRQMRPNEWLVETNAAQLHIAHLAQDAELLGALGATKQEAATIRVFGQYTTASAKRGEEHWAIRGMGADFDALRWRLPQQRREVEELIAEARRYNLRDHTGDRLMALWLADCRLKGLGALMYLEATSR